MRFCLIKLKQHFLNHKKLLAYCHLMRIDKPIGILLLLWPTLWALWIAASGKPSLQILIIFITGICLMRTAGCIVNDYVDCKFDSYVKRTTCRPLPNGSVSKKEVYTLFIILVLCSFLLVLNLNILTVILSIVALAITLIYPFMKRYTYLPQLVLGTAFSWPILMTFTAISKITSISCWIMFIANTLWVMAYDTQYAMLDIDDDIKIGIKSTAILFGRKDYLVIGLLQITMLILMIVVGYLNSLSSFFYWMIFFSGMLFLQQHRLILKRKYNAYFEAFMNNNYVGLFIFLGIAISYM